MNTAAELVVFQRARRNQGPQPAGNILDSATLVANLTAVLEQHIEHLKDTWPKQARRWDGNIGKLVPDGPPPDPFDASRDPTACALALLIGYIADADR